KRYKNPRNGYSRAQERSRLAAVIDEELAFEHELRTQGDDGMAALLRSPAPTVETPTAAVAAGAPAAAPAPAAPRLRALPEPADRSAAPPAADESHSRIRALDRLLGLLRRAR